MRCINGKNYPDDLREADLREEELCGADLYEADLRGADLCGTKNIPPEVVQATNICPEGDITGWKKLQDGVVCKLLIPASAKRSNATSHKCRAEYAIVLEGEGYATHDKLSSNTP